MTREVNKMSENQIKEYRLKQNKTLKELADEAKISVGYLSHLERGSRKNPSKGVMERISVALHQTIPTIFFSK